MCCVLEVYTCFGIINHARLLRQSARMKNKKIWKCVEHGGFNSSPVKEVISVPIAASSCTHMRLRFRCGVNTLKKRAAWPSHPLPAILKHLRRPKGIEFTDQSEDSRAPSAGSREWIPRGVIAGRVQFLTDRWSISAAALWYLQERVSLLGWKPPPPSETQKSPVTSLRVCSCQSGHTANVCQGSPILSFGGSAHREKLNPL